VKKMAKRQRRTNRGWNPIETVKAVSKAMGKPVVNALKAGGSGAVSAGKTVGKAAVAVGKDAATCVTGLPCVMGDVANYIAVNGALVAGVVGGVQLAVASCNPVSAVATYVAGVVAGAQVTALSGAGLFYYNRAVFGGT
jgi:hypothetical protein